MPNVVCVSLINGTEVIGGLVDETKSKIVLMNPYIMEEFDNTITLRRYNFLAEVDQDKVSLSKKAVVSCYQVASKVEHFYQIYVDDKKKNARSFDEITRIHEPGAPSPEPDKSGMLDIATLRKAVTRSSDD